MESTGMQIKDKTQTYTRAMSHFWTRITKEAGFHCLNNYFTRQAHSASSHKTHRKSQHTLEAPKQTPVERITRLSLVDTKHRHAVFCHKDTAQKRSSNKRVWHVSACFWGGCFPLTLSSDATYLPAHTGISNTLIQETLCCSLEASNAAVMLSEILHNFLLFLDNDHRGGRENQFPMSVRSALIQIIFNHKAWPECYFYHCFGKRLQQIFRASVFEGVVSVQ